MNYRETECKKNNLKNNIEKAKNACEHIQMPKLEQDHPRNKQLQKTGRRMRKMELEHARFRAVIEKLEDRNLQVVAKNMGIAPHYLYNFIKVELDLVILKKLEDYLGIDADAVIDEHILEVQAITNVKD